MGSILLVEDDKTIAMGVEYSLVQEGFNTCVCHTADSARQALNHKNFDMVILDISLPDGDGFELCRLIRQNSSIPVIFLTACDEEVNVIMGLDLGADDYITKPFRVRELISRIKSVLRRYNHQVSLDKEIIIGDIRINTAEAKVYKKKKSILLTTLEYKLLLILAGSRGRTLSRNQILESIWDVPGDFVNDNTLTVYIKRLREKIEDDPGKPEIIKTIRGLGYRVGE
ncbi:response regulator transcription factor [Candidatus Contubernalis alkaliaceticus]|uniref:response regulator transcription factor n=1 Tax=Candidatus Contubernalis alkaliaceticus TaxID=338645 RepID=UPI001F4BDFCE|nr:response regulator transcription factor [Candidatus Contubernalis alkalaceticus]UNC91083.1 response regulator transcription factor [Candidatus Contubernalis alkalaceticus]